MRYVFDTNVFQYGTRAPQWLDAQLGRHSPWSVSAVVLSELRRHALLESLPGIAALERLARRGHVHAIVPTLDDWIGATRFLRTLLPARGGPLSSDVRSRIRDAQNDALLAASVWNRGYTLVTCDGDFGAIRAALKVLAARLARVPPPR